MDREQRIYKLKNGSDTALWAVAEIERLEGKIREFGDLGNEFDRMHKSVDSRYVAERIFTVELGAP